MGRFSKAQLRAYATSLSAWELPRKPSTVAPPDVCTNEDMDPVPAHLRTWTGWTFALYWCSDLINAGSWSQVSSFPSLGLPFFECVLSVFVGGVLLSIIIALNGVQGATLHVPFAISARAPFGYNLSKFAVVSRMVIAWFWFSINTYQGGTGVKLMLIAIWPSFRHLPNHLPASSGTDTSSMLCFFLFWLIQFPFTLIHPRKLQPLFLLKAIAVPVTALAMMVWSVVAAGDQASTVLAGTSKLTGLDHWFAFMTAVTACMGTWSTMATSIGDFSRYSKKPASAALQIIFVPLLWTICAMFGAIASNMALAIYGELLWQPFDIIDKWEGSRGGRAAAFFASLAWAIGNLGTNITANSISSAADLTTLFPRWINLRRGQFFAVFVGCWAFAPWKVLGSAGNFISFMSSYSIVLAPLAAILASDFFLVKKCRYDVPALYDLRSIYRYNKWGINWRALIALVVAVGPNLPGMIHTLNGAVEIGKMKYLYAVADIYGILVAGGVHWLLSTLFPDHASIIERAVSSDDVLDAKVFDDYTSTAATTSAERVGENRSVEEKEAAMLKAEGAV